DPTREIRWMQPYLDVMKRIWMASCIAPLYQGDRFLGTLGADVAIEDLLEWLRGLRIGVKGYAFLLSSSGVPLAIPSSETDDLVKSPLLRQALREAAKPTAKQSWTKELETAMQGSILDNAPRELTALYSRMIEQKSGVELIAFPGEKKIVAYCPVGEAGLSVGIVMPVEESLSSLQPVLTGIDVTRAHYILSLIIFVVFSALAAGAIGAWGGRRFARPIKDLIDAISRVSKGGAWKEIRAGTTDEFQELAESANVMVRRIAENEQMLESLFNGVNDAICLHDGVSGRILRVNDRMCEMYRCTKEQAFMLSIEGISSNTPPYTAESARAWLDRALAGETPVFEWHSRDLGGRLFWTEIALRRIEISDEPCIIATVRDIMARKEADEKLRSVEEQLRQSQRLESIGRLAGGVAHDFNNMLTPVLGYAQIIKELLPESDRLKPMVEQIILAGNRCRALVWQLLAFARKQMLNLKPIDLNEVLNGFYAMLRHTLRENVRIEFRLASHVDRIQGDTGQIEQVILNLA
ncbi:MAG TPA: PAS domain S-box protein, partial [Candidatus Ozemobacteraceae bacterium]|nr:PAS domain S-box protein [Candidatus Ozemobacteraceae bacterium]